MPVTFQWALVTRVAINFLYRFWTIITLLLIVMVSGQFTHFYRSSQFLDTNAVIDCSSFRTIITISLFVPVSGHAVCGGDRAVCGSVPETAETLQLSDLTDAVPGQRLPLHADEAELRPRQCTYTSLKHHSNLTYLYTTLWIVQHYYSMLICFFFIRITDHNVM